MRRFSDENVRKVAHIYYLQEQAKKTPSIFGEIFAIFVQCVQFADSPEFEGA